MQRDENKNLQLAKFMGKLIRELRIERTSLSVNKFADGYDISRGNLSKIENGEVECKFVTVWKIAEALGMKPSEFVKALETVVGQDFKIIDE